MKKIVVTAFAIVFFFASNAQLYIKPPDKGVWYKWKNLVGDWVGEGSGNPGNGTGWFSFYFDLDKKILVRKNQAKYLASATKEAYTHDDLMIIYPGEKGEPDKAVYFDNEGHVINYGVTFSVDYTDVIFTSEPTAGAMRFKLTYVPVGKDKINIKFEIAQPGKSDAFSTYIEASAVRKK